MRTACRYMLHPKFATRIFFPVESTRLSNDFLEMMSTIIMILSEYLEERGPCSCEKSGLGRIPPENAGIESRNLFFCTGDVEALKPVDEGSSQKFFLSYLKRTSFILYSDLSPPSEMSTACYAGQRKSYAYYT